MSVAVQSTLDGNATIQLEHSVSGRSVDRFRGGTSRRGEFMQTNGQFERAPVLDPVERITEVIFGLLMAMTFTGTISVSTAAQAAERTMMIAALGCNLAW